MSQLIINLRETTHSDIANIGHKNPKETSSVIIHA